MKIKTIFFILFSFLFQENFSELKSYINKLEKGDMDVPYETIYSYEKIAPNHPVYLYLRGLIEIDGDKAVEYRGQNTSKYVKEFILEQLSN